MTLPDDYQQSFVVPEIAVSQPVDQTASRPISLKLNYLFNLLSGVWSALLGILFVPVYLSYVGIEGYGLIGFFSSLQALLFLLDLGLSPTFNRELARLSTTPGPETANRMKDLTRSLATVNAAVTVVIGLLLAILSPIMAHYWVNAASLSVQDVTVCFFLMSVSSALGFPGALYSGGLAGLQRQVASNIILIVFGTLRAVGSIVVLAFISPTIQAFLLWQAISIVLQMITTILVFQSYLPESDRVSRFDPNIIKGLSRFAAGNVGIGLASLLLLQVDKFVLSKMVSLEEFGYYALATMVSMTALAMLVSVVAKVAYPQFSSLVALNDQVGLARAYHMNSQLASVLVIPTAMILVAFSHEILLLWTRNEAVALRSAPLLTLTALGTGLNCLLWIPYNLQLAHGWTRLTIYFNAISLLLYVPLLVFSTFHYGPIGAAASWLALNTVYFFVYIYLMHQRILKHEMSAWILKDILPVSVVVLAIILIGRLALNDVWSALSTTIFIAVVGALSYVAGGLSAEFVRNHLNRIGRGFLEKSKP